MMLMHWATLLPVSLPGSVAVHGPSVPVRGSNVSYKAKPPFTPWLLFSNFSAVGEVGGTVNPTDVFDVPKVQVARPLA